MFSTGGETIREIQNTAGCKINVTPASGSDVEREIGLVGTRAAIEQAKVAIMDKVRSVVSPYPFLPLCPVSRPPNLPHSRKKLVLATPSSVPHHPATYLPFLSSRAPTRHHPNKPPTSHPTKRPRSNIFRCRYSQKILQEERKHTPRTAATRTTRPCGKLA